MSEERVAEEQGAAGQAVPEEPEAEAAAPDAQAPEEARSQEAAADQVEEDLDELGRAQKERDEYLELAQRTKADFENYRKRVSKDTADALVRGKSDLARQLIPVLDNLERALAAGGGDDALTEGVRLVEAELRATLERAGVESYDPAGEPFDPAWHEALSTRAQEGSPAGTVVETLERGYRLDGQVLRPARVVVSE
jgi:molecular chaperone GrpE